MSLKQRGHAMRTFDFAPLYRSTVGFDRMFSMLDQLGGTEVSVPSYPPYNIERNGENAFRISVAVAGFTDADLSIEANLEDLPSQTRGWDRGVADHVGEAALPFGSSGHYAFFPVAAPCFWMKTLICSRSEAVADAGLNPRQAFRKSKS